MSSRVSSSPLPHRKKDLGDEKDRNPVLENRLDVARAALDEMKLTLASTADQIAVTERRRAATMDEVAENGSEDFRRERRHLAGRARTVAAEETRTARALRHRFRERTGPQPDQA